MPEKIIQVSVPIVISEDEDCCGNKSFLCSFFDNETGYCTLFNTYLTERDLDRHCYSNNHFRCVACLEAEQVEK